MLGRALLGGQPTPLRALAVGSTRSSRPFLRRGCEAGVCVSQNRGQRGSDRPAHRPPQVRGPLSGPRGNPSVRPQRSRACGTAGMDPSPAAS